MRKTSFIASLIQLLKDFRFIFNGMMYADIIEFKCASRHIYTICKPCVQDQPRLHKTIVKLSQGFGGTLEKGFYFRGTGKQRPNFERTGRTKTIFGNRELREKILDRGGGGAGEQAH